MNWFERYPKAIQPTLEEISDFIASPLWNGLCTWAEETYQIEPKVEHSTCSGAPGWNVKYRKSSRALCTLYPDEGQFTAMVTMDKVKATEQARIPMMIQGQRCLYQGLAAVATGIVRLSV